MKPALLRISIKHNVSYAEVVRLSDAIEHDGKIVYPELSDMPESVLSLIQAAHEAVAEDQVRRGVIKDGEQTVIIPRKRIYG